MPSCPTYEEWIQAQGIPIYRDYFVEDARELKLEPWSAMECNGAFLQLVGQEGVVEARVIEIPPGKTLPPLKMGVDEAIYVVQGQGLTAVWGADGSPKKTFEWGPHSLFLAPSNTWRQVSNMSGAEPARLLIYSYLPVAVAATTDIDFFINNPYENPARLEAADEEFYSQAKAVKEDPNSFRAAGKIEHFWVGNFFPDLQAWDKLTPFYGRGAGGRAVYIHFPNSELTAHMSVFPSRTYKKAHRHGPGVVIIIPGGEGYSVMWPEGGEKVIVPWREGSIFVPPNKYFHQHFNLGGSPARYLAFHAPPQLKLSEKIDDIRHDQIEYTNEASEVRERFEGELAKRGLTSLMPPQAYEEETYEWQYEPAAEVPA